jgi:uncharacterized protein (DUF4415 family)
MEKRIKRGRPLQRKSPKKHITLRLEQRWIDKIKKLGKGSIQKGMEKLVKNKWDTYGEVK